MLNKILSQFNQLWHYLLPSPCLWCNQMTDNPTSQLCSYCTKALPSLPYELCHYNLLWLPAIDNGLKNPEFDSLLSVSIYEQPYRHWISRWKFSKDYGAGQLLKQQFVDLLFEFKAQTANLPQAILYVPMLAKKQRKRGFNQALILASAASSALNIPLMHCLVRKGKQHSQVGLTKKERKANLKGAFAFKGPAALPESIALVDDVLTTGATANEVCRVLKKHGVKHISLWTLSVTLTP